MRLPACAAALWEPSWPQKYFRTYAVRFAPNEREFEHWWFVIKQVFDLHPGAIICDLDLRRPIYQQAGNWATRKRRCGMISFRARRNGQHQRADNRQSALEVVADYVAALAACDSETMKALRAPGYVLDWVYADAFGNRPLSAEDTERFWPAWFAGFSESDYEVLRTIAAETVVVTQWIFTGTHSDPIGPPVFDPPHLPTGRTIRCRAVSIYDIGDGVITRETTYLDLATLLVELGVEVRR
jgi:steroid delta-isomerase-like uncharacterized protein